MVDEVGEEVCEEVPRQVTDVAANLVVEDETGDDGRLVLPRPAPS